MIHTNRGHRIDTIFVLIIFCVFAVSVLMVLMLSASTYENVTELSREGHADRSVLSYIWTKVKNSDNAGQIHVGEFHGLSALYIEEDIGQTQYKTVVYHYNGWVYELFCEADLEFRPEDGAQIIRIENLTFEDTDNGSIIVSSGGNNLIIFPRGSVPEPDSLAVLAESGVVG